MNLALWVVQGLLAVVFLMTGGLKVAWPKEKLLERMHALEDIDPIQIKMIGIVEIMATLGLILPWLLNILPWLTPLAAVGCILLMIGAIRTHLQRGEGIAVQVIILILAACVAIGRAYSL